MFNSVFRAFSRAVAAFAIAIVYSACGASVPQAPSTDEVRALLLDRIDTGGPDRKVCWELPSFSPAENSIFLETGFFAQGSHAGPRIFVDYGYLEAPVNERFDMGTPTRPKYVELSRYALTERGSAALVSLPREYKEMHGFKADFAFCEGDMDFGGIGVAQPPQKDAGTGLWTAVYMVHLAPTDLPEWAGDADLQRMMPALAQWAPGMDLLVTVVHTDGAWVIDAVTQMFE